MSTTTEIIKNYINENKTVISLYFIINIITLFLETIILSYITSSLFGSIQKGSSSSVYKYIIIFFIVFVLIRIGYSVKSVLYDDIIPTFYNYVKTLLYEEILERYKTDYKELNLGTVQYNFQNLPYHICRVVVELLQEYIPNTIAIIFCIIYLLYTNIWIGIISILGVLLVAITVGTRFLGSQNLSTLEHEASLKSASFIDDKLNNLFNIYVSGTEKDELQEQNDIEKNLETKMTSNYLYNTQTTVIIDVILIFVVIIILYFVYNNCVTKKLLNPSSAVLIIILMNYYTGYISRISQNLVSVIDVTGYLDQANIFLQELNSQTNIQTNLNTSTQSNLNTRAQMNLGNQTGSIGSITFDNVSFSYNNERSPVLKNINMTINKNESVAIYGQSGSGKSTIIKLLFRFYEPTSGTIKINDIPITNISINDLRKNIAIMSQTVKLFDKSIYENIIYGSEESNIANIDLSSYSKALELLGPLDKNVGPLGSNLSGGQKQIVNILRTLVQAQTKNKNIIIFDEPTSALDSNTKEIIMSLITSTNKTIIIVTHDAFVKRYVNTTYILIDGSLKNVSDK
jgi:ABC-type multidrug transport system fused ATPase/permease subunit